MDYLSALQLVKEVAVKAHGQDSGKLLIVDSEGRIDAIFPGFWSESPFLGMIEDATGIIFTDPDLADLETFGDLARFISENAERVAA